ncbi:MAG: Tetraacyldisaccharide 4'-kinase [candidate division Zixibacteria bacterium RBG-1]|nr:MAG: Tetraacyldisaccharide 4'-kinase [candidate division Zixibacteria bacterium RBG-1]OGC86609.1 MAG: tetraacyldisaccharide 4'-kinase [candidate division Zixibacteria bacterium RBG_19FT_COMBO_42_43]
MLENLKFQLFQKTDLKKLLILKPILILLSWLYFLLYSLGNFLYSVGILKTRDLKKDFPNAKVISIGNITVGGTGKTPWTIFLADKISKSGKKVAILTRGYGRKSSGQLILDEKNKTQKNWWEVGDEPFLMASKLNGIPIVVNSDRAEAGRWVLQNRQAQVLILDDGFQNKSLKKDLEIVIIDATNPFGNFKLLPAGILREPTKNLKRADLLILNKVDQDASKQKLLNYLTSISKAPIIKSQYGKNHFVNVYSEEIMPIEQLNEKSGLAFCGIANPYSFISSLNQSQIQIAATKFFPDHYVYKEKDMLNLVEEGLNQKVDFLVTTEKDKVRLPKIDSNLPIYALGIQVEITIGEEVLEQKLKQVLGL